MSSILFKHEAKGKDGIPIVVYKIRTMRGLVSPKRNSRLSLSGQLDITDKQRVTKIGKFLRPTGLDEIPQIFNIIILRNMQLIGIRPFLIEEFELLPEDIQKRLLFEKPGMIPAESYYEYRAGILDSRITAIRKYLDEKPKGLKKVKIGLIALIKRWTKYSKR